MTIYDIAKEVGVSASTVSRVINHKPGIKSETRAKVEAVLEKYNYFPDEAARGLVKQTTRFIGILVSDIRLTHHAEGAYVIERRLSRLGYSCIIFNTGAEEEAKADCIRRLASHHVAAVVMIGSVFQTEQIKALIEAYLKDLPVILSNGYLDLPNVYGVLADEQGGVKNCVDLLHRKGKKHPAFLNDSMTISNRRKQVGFEEGIALFYPSVEPLIYKTSKEDQGSVAFGYDETIRIMQSHPETDGIIYATDLCAAGGLQALHEMGIAVPGQVAVIGVDNSVYAELCRPQLTSLDNRLRDLSITCADILVKVIQKNEAAKKYMIFSEIIERQTV